MEVLFANMTLILAVIGILAFCVSVITQVFKGVGVLSRIPTDALVFVLSIGRNPGGRFCGIHAVYPDADIMVHDSGSYHGRLYRCLCGYVWLGKAHGAVEKNE